MTTKDEDKRLFRIDASTGVVQTTQPLDREDMPWHNITVMASEVGRYQDHLHTLTSVSICLYQGWTTILIDSVCSPPLSFSPNSPPVLFLESENSVSVEFWFDTGSQHDEMVFHKSDGFRSKPVDELQSFDQVSIHFLSLIYFYFNLRTSSNLHWRRISIFLYLIQSHLGPVSCSRPALMKTTFMWWSFWQTSQSILFPHQ